MKIAVFTDTFSPEINGVTNTLGRMTRFFDENAIEYKIFAPRYDLRDRSPHTERFYSMKFLLYPQSRFTLPNLFRVDEVLREFKPDIVQIMTEFNMGFIGLNYAKRNGIASVSNYSTNFSQYMEYYNLGFAKPALWDYLRWFHNQNKVTLCPSRETQRLLEAEGIENTDILSRGIDISDFNPRYRNPALREKLGLGDKTALLYVGRVSIEKDLDVLQAAYRKISRDYGDEVALIITGDGPYLEKARETFAGNTLFTGFKRGPELAEIYASCDVFVCPSSSETFGNVVLEAMASGLPVIGADAGGVGELIDHGVNGLTFEAGNPQSLTGRLDELLKDTALRQRLASQGLSFAEGRSWQGVFSGLLETYGFLLECDTGKTA
ncbi:MAG: glycosyl transferase family 1 [delta proteobacterium ML8_F1]|nr:MAG: glycosyl transferase family 1 [delta proteobacterium ML8_F1]